MLADFMFSELRDAKKLSLAHARAVELGVSDSFTKHLAGKHDQKTHGNGGLHTGAEAHGFWSDKNLGGKIEEPDIVAQKKIVSSDISKRMSENGVTSQEFLDYHRQFVHQTASGQYQEPTKKWEGTKPLSEIVTVSNPDLLNRVNFESMKYFADVDMEEVTWEQAQDLLNSANKNRESHLQYFLLDDGGQQRINDSVASNLVTQWAGSSNDENANSLFIQERAASLFKIDDAASWNINDETRKVMDSFTPHQKLYDAFLSSQYEATQEAFKAQGIKEITLYRGVHLEIKPFQQGALYETPEQASNGFDIKFVSRPLSSWTTSVGVSQLFGGEEKRGEKGYVFKQAIPVKNIFSTPLTGIGCLNEREMVVLGGEQDVLAIGYFDADKIADK